MIACYDCNTKRGDKIDKCWCSFCQVANERWLNAGLAMRATKRRTDEERAAMFRQIWSKREDNKGKNYSH